MYITKIAATLQVLTSPGSAVNPDKSFMSTMIMLMLFIAPLYLEKLGYLITSGVIITMMIPKTVSLQDSVSVNIKSLLIVFKRLIFNS